MTGHKRGFRAIGAAILAFTLAASSSLTAFGTDGAGQVEKQTYIQGELLVMYRGEVTGGEIEAMAKAQGDNGGEVIAQTGEGSIARVSLSADVSVEQAMKEYASDQRVVAVTPNFELELYASNPPVNDTDFSFQAYLNQINIPEAWELVKGKAKNKVKVAVLDTGAQLDHPDLTNIVNVNLSKEVLSDGSLGALQGDGYVNGQPSKGGGHGTHVSGLVAAEANNGLGIAGAGSGADNSIVDLINIDVFAGEKTSLAHVILGMEYSKSIGVKVLNLSLGAKKIAVGDSDKFLKATCDSLAASGIVIVSAAGNDGIDDKGAVNVVPSDYDSTISVIAVDDKNEKAKISNYGLFKDISAPGVNIYSTIPGGSYTRFSGTSMATPQVAGTVAMMLAMNPSLDARTVKKIIRETATDIGTPGFDSETASGLINAQKAVEVAIASVPPTDPPVAPPTDPPVTPPTTPPTDIPIVNPGKPSYSDVNPGDWYYEGVDYMYKRGIMTGINPTVFGASDVLSRAQFATIVYRISGEGKSAYSSRFPDVGDKEFYTNAVMWAVNAGIIKGYDNGKFGPSDTVTREQMAVMLYRFVQYLGKDTTARGDLNKFPDAKSISKFARESMEWANAEGIITGNGNGTLAPQGAASRAACAVIMMRFLK